MKRLTLLLPIALVFSLLSQNAVAQCLSTLDSSSTPTFPTTGTIAGGVTYEFCLNVLTWNTSSANWFHGVELVLGAGWDLASVTPTVNPTSCAGSGVWDFYPSCTSSSTGATWGQGWYYDTDAGSGGAGLDGIPGNNYGDFCTTSATWNFCFEVTTNTGVYCVDGADLSVGFNTLGDGESGSWSSFDCNFDAEITWPGPTLACCDPPLLTIQDPLCAGDATGSISAMGTSIGPYTFDWSTGLVVTSPDSSFINGLAAGTYVLNLTDGNGCISATTIDLFDPPVLDLVVDLVQEVRCPGGNDGAIFVTGSGGTGQLQYYIDGGAAQLTGDFFNLSAATYNVSVIDSAGCVTTIPVDVIEDNLLELTVTNVIDASCSGSEDGLIEVLASGGYPPYQYSIDGITWQAFESFSGLPAGDYTILVMDDAGCQVQTTATITEPVLLVVDAGTYIPISGGGDVDLNPTTNAGTVASWMWNPPEGLSCTGCEMPNASPETSIWYFLTIVDDNGCTAFDSTYIKVVNALVIPNAFTPNGDGLNDVFLVTNPFIDEFVMSIYDRWGTLVFQTNDINIGWDGTYQGVEVENASYIFVISASTREGLSITESGTITLIK